jgi:hypothetical protein
VTYESWRISYQSSEQAARAAFNENVRLHRQVEVLTRQMSILKDAISSAELAFWALPDADGPAQKMENAIAEINSIEVKE